MSVDLSRIPHVATPATQAFMTLLESGSEREAVEVLDEHWLEVWYAMDPADLKKILLNVPAETYSTFNSAVYLNDLAGTQLVAAPAAVIPEAPKDRLNHVGRQVGALRTSGKPEAALVVAKTLDDDIQALRGRLVDTSGGRVGMWLVQGGITALLAGDLPLARSCFSQSASGHRPDRFPFVHREALAKLALTHAIAGDLAEARSCMARADELPRTTSWVEALVDDSLRLARYICAIDALDLEAAEEMRLADSSPFTHLEFWGVALQAQVRHLCLTGRRDQARSLCDEVASAGLPLPGSDGWVSRMLDDAYLHCAPLSEVEAENRLGSPAERLLARRLHLLSTGQFSQLTTRDSDERSPEVQTRTRLGLDLIRGQGLLHSGRTEDGRRLLQATLTEACDRGTQGVLQFLTVETLDAIGDTLIGKWARQLVDEHSICLVEVTHLLQSPLSVAETKALRMLAAGMSRAQIAQASYVSVETVKSQLAAAYRKLGVNKRDDAIAMFEKLEG